MIVKEKRGGQFFELYKGDCLEVMQNMPYKSIDAIITDPPYGTTSCKWDAIISIDKMFFELFRIIKKGRPIILFASEPFASRLRAYDFKKYKYDWIWDKTFGMGQNAKHMPIKSHENILMFYEGKIKVYNPQMTQKEHFRPFPKTYKTELMDLSKCKRDKKHLESGFKYPVSIYTLSSRIAECNPLNRIHPTQKPVELMKYLILTYTNENETILDFTMGSGSTGVAAMNTKRNFIGIEKDDKYFDIAVNRIKGTEPKPQLADKPKERGLFSFTDEPTKAD